MPTDDATTTEGVLAGALAEELDGLLLCSTERVAAALAALLVPTREVDCPTCGGLGFMYQCDDPADESVRCDCMNGKVTRRALDVWLAEQEDQWTRT